MLLITRSSASSALVGLLAVQAISAQSIQLPNLFPFPNGSGILQSWTTSPGGKIDLSGPFFQNLGTNGRSCFSCHRPDQGWSISAQGMQILFALTGGNDPVFRATDGSNCDTGVDLSSVSGRKQAFSLLTSRGLIRVALPVSPSAEFQVTGVTNQYGCGSLSTLSMYRRPLPSANLKFLSGLMWDGRESTGPDTQKITYATNPGDLNFDLAHQAMDAVAGHAQGATPLPPQIQQQIVDFETHLFTAQSYDYAAGSLNGNGATGGPQAIASQQFFVGINDPLGGNPFGTAFTPEVFTLYKAWANSHGFGGQAREAIARGEALFNSKRINITGVAGLNDALGAAVIPGTCGTCHSSPNAGNHSVALPINIGVADTTNSLGVSYLPVITLRNKTTGATVQTTDPGRALITGKWEDIGKFKGPVLRALASRAPYFHNGSAQTLSDVIEFYNNRFAMGLTAQEKSDLAAFLAAL